MTDKSIGPAPRGEPPHQRGRNTPFMITLGVVVGWGVFFFFINAVSPIPRWKDFVEQYNVTEPFPVLEQHSAIGDYPIGEDDIVRRYYSSKKTRSAEEAKRRSQIVASGFKAADHLIVAVGALAKERGLTYAALKTNTLFDPDLRTQIDVLRQVSDGAFAEVLRIIQPQSKGDGWYASSTEVDRLRSQLDVERRRIETVLTQLDAGVDVDSSLRWFQATTRAIEKSNIILRSIHQYLRENSSRDVEAGLHLQQIALLMTDYAGRERAIVYAALLRQTKLDDDPLYRSASNIRSHMNIRWQEAKALARIHSLSPALVHLMSEIDRSYFEGMNTTRKIIEQANATKSNYPITSVQWFQQVTKSIDRMLTFGRSAGDFALEKSVRPRAG